MNKIIIFFLSCFLFINPLLAVDGYKDLKFGITPEELKKSKLCAWSDDILSVLYTKAFYCRNFKFNGKLTDVYSYFIDNKFLRLIILADYEDRHSILSALKKKYGAMSYTKSQEAIERFYKAPNQSLWFDFDNNTVQLMYKSDKNYKKSLALFYTSSLYYELLEVKSSQLLMDDL